MRIPTWIIAFIRCWLYENRVFLFFSYTVLYNVRWHLFLVFAISFACVWGEQSMFIFLASDVHKLAYTLLTQNKKNSDFRNSSLFSEATCLCDLHMSGSLVWVWVTKLCLVVFFTVNYTCSSSTHCHCISSLCYFTY